MKHKHLFPALTLLCFLFVACNPAVPPDKSRAWIDAPRNGSRLPIAPVEIVSHAADQTGIAQVEISINGSVHSDLPPDDTTSSLVTVRRIWDPPGPGVYTLGVRAQNSGGAWSEVSQVAVTILEPDHIREIPTETPTEVETIPTATEVVTTTPEVECSNRARFVTDITVPDNTVFTPGVEFTKTWRMSNEGTCPWDSSYSLIYHSGEQMGNVTSVSLTSIVQPGSTVDLSVRLTSPINNGTYRENWILEDGEAQAFGIGDDADRPFWVQIVVESSPPPGITPTSLPPDFAPPVPTIEYSPSGTGAPTENDVVTFSVVATDNIGVVKIEIWVTPPGQGAQLVKTCNNATTCVYQGGPYTVGQLGYMTKAWDAAGNTGSTWPATLWIFAVPK